MLKGEGRTRRQVSRSARVAELVDAQDLGSCGATRGGSSPPFRTSRSLIDGSVEKDAENGW